MIQAWRPYEDWKDNLREFGAVIGPPIMVCLAVATLLVVLSRERATPPAPPATTPAECPGSFVPDSAGACRGSCDITGIARMTWDEGEGTRHATCECVPVPSVGVMPVKRKAPDAAPR